MYADRLNEEQASSTKEPQGGEGDGEKEDEVDDTKIDPFIKFECALCHMTASTFYKELQCSDGYYASPVFYMRDPFTPPPRIRGRKPVLADYVVVGVTCSMCEMPVCLAKSCSLYFGSSFCTSCVLREKRRFPEKLVEQVVKAQPKEESGK